MPSLIMPRDLFIDKIKDIYTLPNAKAKLREFISKADRNPSNSNLGGINLSGIDLSSVDFKNSNLGGSDLSESRLHAS